MVSTRLAVDLEAIATVERGKIHRRGERSRLTPEDYVSRPAPGTVVVERITNADEDIGNTVAVHVAGCARDMRSLFVARIPGHNEAIGTTNIVFVEAGGKITGVSEDDVGHSGPIFALIGTHEDVIETVAIHIARFTDRQSEMIIGVGAFDPKAIRSVESREIERARKAAGRPEDDVRRSRTGAAGYGCISRADDEVIHAVVVHIPRAPDAEAQLVTDVQSGNDKAVGSIQRTEIDFTKRRREAGRNDHIVSIATDVGDTKSQAAHRHRGTFRKAGECTENRVRAIVVDKRERDRRDAADRAGNIEQRTREVHASDQA